VEEHLRRRDGVAISLLYSDVPPDYYARHGYRLCPAHEGWAGGRREPSGSGDAVYCGDTSPARFAGPAEVRGEMRLIPVDLRHDLPEMAAMYAAFHGLRPLAIARPDDYWEYLARKGPADEFFWLADVAGSRFGYVRLAAIRDAWRIADYALARQEEGLLVLLYDCVLGMAAQRGIARVVGWLPQTPAAQRGFAVRPRAKEITMVKALEAAVDLSAEALAAADWFCEVDHV
jgi:hypothetical protein